MKKLTVLWLLAPVLIYLAAYLFTPQYSKDIEEGIENCNALEKQLVGRWYTSFAQKEGDKGRRYRRFKDSYFVLRADKNWWRKQRSNSDRGLKRATWSANAKDSILTIDCTANYKNNTIQNYKIRYLDSTSIRLDRIDGGTQNPVYEEWSSY